LGQPSLYALPYRALFTLSIELLWRKKLRNTRVGTRKLLRWAAGSTHRRFDQRHLVEVGIGCEACHLGSAQHVADPHVRPSFEPRSPFLRALPPGGKPAATRAPWVNQACMRCHTVLFSRYPYTWEGKRRRDALPGGSNVNSGEARNFQLGGCSQQLACSDCHDPHQRDDAQKRAALATVSGNATCTRCHARYAQKAALEAHTHHRQDSVGSACLACHMPKKNMGLKYDLTRYHRIASPTEIAKVTRDRPLECVLCHADFSIEKTVATMERWWGKRYDRNALRVLYGKDLQANALERTLLVGKAHEQVVAAAVLARTGDKRWLPLLVGQLAHRYPLVRYYAHAAIERLTAKKLPLDMSLSGPSLLTTAKSALGLP
jgi:predicted CXXCH cytochrome family protein